MDFMSATALLSPDSLEELQRQLTASNLLPVYNFGSNLLYQSVQNTGGVNELENDPAPGTRKRQRVNELLPTREHTLIPYTDLQQQQSNGTSAFVTPQTAVSGVHLLTNNDQVNPTVAFAAAGRNASFISSIVREELRSEMIRQKQEMDQFINIQGEQMKHVLEATRRKYVIGLLGAVKKGILKRLTEKEAELEKVNRKNLELEDLAQQLSMESRLWQNVAKNKEEMVSNLRTSLEQVVEAKDAGSCNHGEVNNVHSGTVKGSKELKEQRACKWCRMNNVCILLLPCRHLCLCKDCESRLEACPICKSPKNASVQVYMT